MDVLSFSLVYSGQALTVRGETEDFNIFDFKLRFCVLVLFDDDKKKESRNSTPLKYVSANTHPNYLYYTTVSLKMQELNEPNILITRYFIEIVSFTCRYHNRPAGWPVRQHGLCTAW